jgi:STE24 endopeptidase
MDFTDEERERASRYHRPLYGLLAVDVGSQGALLAVLAFTVAGDWLYDPFTGSEWWLAAPGFAALVAACLFALRAPLSLWRGLLRERRWGFSTQTALSWLTDLGKVAGIGLGLSAIIELALVAFVRWLPHAWPAVTAAAAALGTAFLSFAAPLLFEPLFNRFRPLADTAFANELRELGRRAGVPIRDVLVADASRRTRKVNAYVSGLGRTRRIVVFDTLLDRASPAEVKLVVAHELGHTRSRHVLKGTLLAMLGAVVAVLLVWAALGSDAGDPRQAPTVFLLGLGLDLAVLLPANALSRAWERAADRASLELTGESETFISAHRLLAVTNLTDLEPPRLAYHLLASHPTPPERIALGRQASVKS